MKTKITLKELLENVHPYVTVKIIYSTDERTPIGGYERKSIKGIISALTAEFSKKLLKKLANLEIDNLSTEITMVTSCLLNSAIVIELVDQPITVD